MWKLKNLAVAALAVASIISWAPVLSYGASLFFVDDSGNVSIGNSNPQSKLDVSGTIYSRLATTTSSVNWNTGNVQSITLTSSPTLTFTNGQAGGEYKLILTQDGTGGRTVTWPGSVKWPGGNAPALTSSANAIDMVSFVYDGTSYIGSYTLNYETSPSGITFDATSSCGAASSCSVTTSGTDRALVTFVVGDVGTDNTPTCTYDGTTMTLIDKIETPSDRWVYGFLLVNPSSGTNTLACTGPTYTGIHSISYDGVQQSGQPDNYTSNSVAGTTTEASLSTDFTVSHTNAWIVAHSEFSWADEDLVSLDGATSSQLSDNSGGVITDSDGPVSSGSHTVFMYDSSTSRTDPKLSELIISLIPAN